MSELVGAAWERLRERGWKWGDGIMAALIAGLLGMAWYGGSPDASGTWEGTASFEGEDFEGQDEFGVGLDLDQSSGGDLSGTASIDGGDPSPIYGGGVSRGWVFGGGEFEIFVESRNPTDPRALVVEGDLEGDEMTGRMSYGSVSAVFEARRTGEPEEQSSAGDEDVSGGKAALVDELASGLAAGGDRYGG